jgi:protein disulfide-isomerase-like protein
MRTAAAAVALALCASASSAMELTPDNWDDETAGKTVFLKFFAPWCGHCKRMKPAWDKLMDAYADNNAILVADVDCTAAGKPLCDSNGVRGFPTIKYGDPSSLEDYNGGRDFDALKSHADGLKPLCSPFNTDLCDEEGKAKIEEMMAMSEDDLSKQIEEGEAAIEAAEKTFSSEVEKLQKKYEQLMEDKEAEITRVKDSGLGLMKSVRAAQAKKSSEL